MNDGTDGVRPTDGTGATEGTPRPGRAELRRAAEAEARATASASASRTERRRQAEQAAKADQVRRSAWRAWWLYPLAALIGLCVYLGFQSAQGAPPESPPIIEVTEAP